MSVAAVVSLAAVTLLHAAADARRGFVGAASRLLLGDEWPEPWQDLAILLPFSLVTVVLVSAVTVWNLRPVTRASEAAARVGPGSPTARIEAPGLPSEIEPLVSAANGALDRLADAYESERRFVADAAHELRTPLAALRLRLQRARAESRVDWHAVDGDLAQMGRLVSQLLELARKEAAGPDGAAGPPEPCNLARIAREAAASVLPLVEQAGRTLLVDLGDHLTVAGHPGDLGDLVRNLLENALLHGRGTIALTGWRDSRGACVLQVTDEGDGVPPALREAVFDRFRKGRQGDRGSGLGLAIVRAVARSHHASVRFVDGSGCRVQLAIPSHPAPARPRASVGRAA